MADETPHDLPTVRVKTGDGHYKIINKKDYDPKEHELIKGGEDQQQGVMDFSGRNPSGTFSEPTPTDIRYPDKDATEYENNHGAFMGKSASQMRKAADLPDAPGGVYPDGAMRVEATGQGRHRVMSGDREVVKNVSGADADKFKKMNAEEKTAWVKSKGGNPPATAEKKADAAAPGQPPSRPTPPPPKQG